MGVVDAVAREVAEMVSTRSQCSRSRSCKQNTLLQGHRHRRVRQRHKHSRRCIVNWLVATEVVEEAAVATAADMISSHSHCSRCPSRTQYSLLQLLHHRKFRRRNSHSRCCIVEHSGNTIGIALATIIRTQQPNEDPIPMCYQSHTCRIEGCIYPSSGQEYCPGR
eukprot:scaffold17802_cov35-Tisochrysis_lutea.AAC.6